MTNKTDFLIRTFGRRRGKKLSPFQQELMENTLPAITPTQALLADDKYPIKILEIGFGAGEHLIHRCTQSPDFQIIGAEPFENGVASCLSEIARNNPKWIDDKKVLIWPDDVRPLLDANKNVRFDYIFVLHPDPWPKARHEKRRLLQVEFLNLLSNYLKDDGAIILGTDHTDYFNWAMDMVSKSNLKRINSDIYEPPFTGLSTRYQVKNKFGSERPSYAVLKRK